MTTPPLTRRILSAGVGLFVIWQLLYLPLANLTHFVPLRPGPEDLNPDIRPFQAEGTFTANEPVQRGVEAAADVLGFWGEVSGQGQGWKLFSPGLPPYSLFSALEFLCADGEVIEVRSRFEPADLGHPPVRPPLVHNRAFNHEFGFSLAAFYCDPESLERFPEIWSKRLPQSVAENNRPILAWMNWHLDRHREELARHGGATEVVLKHRFIPTPSPSKLPGTWTGPVREQPYARWRPGATPEAGTLPVEGYDPVARQFVRLSAEGVR